MCYGLLTTQTASDTNWSLFCSTNWILLATQTGDCWRARDDPLCREARAHNFSLLLAHEIRRNKAVPATPAAKNIWHAGLCDFCDSVWIKHCITKLFKAAIKLHEHATQRIIYNKPILIIPGFNRVKANCRLRHANSLSGPEKTVAELTSFDRLKQYWVINTWYFTFTQPGISPASLLVTLSVKANSQDASSHKQNSRSLILTRAAFSEKSWKVGGEEG